MKISLPIQANPITRCSFWIAVLIFSLQILTACQQVPQKFALSTNPTASVNPPAAVLPAPSETAAQEDQLLTPYPQQTPSSEYYTVVGIEAEDVLNIYQNPWMDSSIIYQISPTGIFIKPESDILLMDKANWIKVAYRGQQGWVDYSHLAEQKGVVPEELIKLGQFVVHTLKSRHYELLADVIHPDYCVRFSPYANLNETNQTLCAEDFPRLASSDQKLNWGSFDGTGSPILMTLSEYQQRFVYDSDYFQPQTIGFDQEVSYGNLINNIRDIYPDGKIIEYYFPGFDPQYGGMDWRSLTLVFIQEEQAWYLTAIVHGEWTI